MELRRAEDRPRPFVELQEGNDLRDVLRKDELIAARQDGDRARAEALELGPTGRISEDIDRFELDPTDREKLLEPQAAGSPGLPERLQRRRFGHVPLRSSMMAVVTRNDTDASTATSGGVSCTL
jgi:hypothetical protein